MMSAGQFIPKKKNANTLRFTPPGFNHPVDVLFPARALPVCERCKKNFKTREHCRTRDCHTGLPWSDTYICMTLENPCTDKDNKLIDGPFVAKAVSPFAFNLQGDIDPKTPICAPCKDKNYTRTYCRHNKRHRQLPWSSIYVSLVPRADGMYPEKAERQTPASTSKRRKTNSGDASTNSSDKQSNGADKQSNGESASAEEENPSSNSEDAPGDNESPKRKQRQKEPEEKDPESEKKEGDNFFDDIPDSRTFLITVSIKKCHLQWLDHDPLNQPNYMRGHEGKVQEDMANGFPSPYNLMGNMGGMGSNMGGMGMGGFGQSPYMDRGGMMPPFSDGSFNGGSGSMRPHYMSPGMMRPGGGYGHFGPGHDSMGFDPRMRGDMGSGGGQTPTEDPHMMGGWGGFNQQEHFMNRMRFDSMSRGGPYHQPYGGMGSGGQFPGGMHPGQGGEGQMSRGFGRQGANGHDNGGGGGNYGSQQGYNQGPAGPSPMERNQAHVESAPPPQGNGGGPEGVANNKGESSRGDVGDGAKEV